MNLEELAFREISPAPIQGTQKLKNIIALVSLGCDKLCDKLP